MNAVDTNVLVYFVDRDEPAKRAKAIELLDGLVKEDVETILLWQVAAEFLSCLRRWQPELSLPIHNSPRSKTPDPFISSQRRRWEIGWSMASRRLRRG